ncbi:GNAT family N-acetyltransferase [Cedecea colo]|uniref:GNAT family N-acetyltransferase n=1 Tax=Cedecea colo TaxID=2552946 RepID=UPI0030843DFF
MEFARSRLSDWIKEYKQHGYGNWAISLREAPERIVGFAGISVRTLNGSLTNNLGYRFSTDVWGRGIATEFCQFALTHGFETLGLQEITAVVRPDHLASQRVLIKAGLRLTGTTDDVPHSLPSQVYKLDINEWHVLHKGSGTSTQDVSD